MTDKEQGKQRCYHLLTLPAAVEVQRLPVAGLSRNPLILKESFPALYATGHRTVSVQHHRSVYPGRCGTAV